jgi:hypothetical protein
MKNISTPPAWHETPRTNALILEVQSTPIPFEIGFWRLLELTRTLEAESYKLQESKQSKQPKNPKIPTSRPPKKKVVASKKQGRPKAKMARNS